MTYKYLVVNDRPDGAWSLDSYPFLDHAGNNRAATGKRLAGYPGPVINYDVADENAPTPQSYSDSVDFARSLVASTGDAASVTPARPLVMDFSLMSHGNEARPFTLECWFRPEKVTTRTTVLGHEGSDDGITFDGDALRFVTNYTASGSSEVEYFPTDTSKAMYVVAVHTSGYNRLYVDGVMVGESFLTDEQRQDSYAPVTNQNVLVSGYSTDATSRLTIDFPATYAHDLRTDRIVSHFQAGRRTDDFYSVIENYGGSYWTLDDSQTSIVRRDDFSSFADWNKGMFDASNGASGSLIPDVDYDGSIMPGSWKWGYILDLGTAIASSKVEWDADGDVTVESSVDNESTWQVVENGRGFTGLNNETESISVRVSFVGDGKVRSLSVVTYYDLTMASNDGTRFLQWFGAASPGSSAFVPIEQSSRGRLQTYEAAGLITASNLPDGLENVGAVELWVNVKAGTDTKYLVDMRVSDVGPRVWIEGQTLKTDSGRVYVNGVSTASDSTFVRGQWQHVVFVPDTFSSNAVWVLGNEQDLNRMSALLGHLAVYPTQLTYAQVADIYGACTGFESIRLREDNAITITEPADEIKVYAFNWSVRTAA